MTTKVSMKGSVSVFVLLLTPFILSLAQGQGLQVWDGANYSGSYTLQCTDYTYYTTDDLGVLDNAISSFKLKQGWACTLAVNADGTGVAQNYVAQDNDVNIAQLPSGLDDQVSFVRVYPWRTTTKKGWSGSKWGATILECDWNYDWDNVDVSSEAIEYVPMRHNQWWNAYSNINNKTGSTHALGFNEPDSADQADMTVATVISEWPNLLASGLRLGSPAPTDGGLSWLYDFFDEADAANLRVDIAACHMYKGGWDGATLHSWLLDIYNQTGRPVWVTEWNNGCNWTCCEPEDAEEQADIIQDFIDTMNADDFVERYAVYNWCGPDGIRQLIEGDGTINPAGQVYIDTPAPVAYIQESYSGQDFGLSSPFVGFYEFNGDTTDSSGSGNDGTATGSPSYVTGVNGQAIDLDGSDDFVTLPPSVAASEDITIAVWVNWDGGGDNQRIFDFGNGTSEYMFLTPASSGQLRYGFRLNEYPYPSLYASALATGVWTHVAVIMEGDIGTLYVNGTAEDSITITGDPIDMSPQNLFIGDSQWSADPFFNGRIDDFRIYSYALSSADIASLAANTPPAIPSAPTGLSASAISQSQINLSWNASAGATSYNVKRATASSGPYSTVVQSYLGTNYSDATLLGGTTYYYVVQAQNISGVSADSLKASATTDPDTTAPDAPANLTTKAGDGFVQLDWDSNFNLDFASFSVKRSTSSGGPYATLATGLTDSEYTDDTTVNGTTYYYVATTIDASSNESDNSAEVSASFSPQLVAFYSFEGNALDSSGNALNGTVSGGTSYVTGVSGQAISLDGVDGYVTLPAGVADSYDITIAAWVNWDGGSIWQRIFDFGNDTSEYMFLTPISSGSTLRFGIKDGGVEEQLNAAQFTTGIWHHVAVTLDGDTGVLYVDGVPQVTNTVTMNPIDFTPVVNYIGKSQWADPYLSGAIDEVRIYNYALTAAEIADLYGGSVNYPPEFSSDPIIRADATEDTAYNGTTLSGEATDPDGDSVTYSKASGPDWLNVASNGSLSGTPSNDDVGVNSFTIQASDGNGGLDSATLNITVVNVNDAPTWISDPITEAGASVDEAYSSSLADDASDVDAGDTLTFSKVSGPSWLTVASDGTLSGTPSSSDIGANSFTVRVTDSASASADATVEIEVSETASMHVNSIALSIVTASRNRYKGQAVVTILDNSGNPVSGAVVTGAFSGRFNETQSATTNSSGVATLTTGASQKLPISFTFCVTNVSHADYEYDSSANVITCNSY
ncbi:cadherin-like domain-containing protein [Candidatus Sumerlaeota bacterium]|nr:cadherin-like domain-containing protein [Candidatus Sumerlaeota bacterium]